MIFVIFLLNLVHKILISITQFRDTQDAPEALDLRRDKSMEMSSFTFRMHQKPSIPRQDESQDKLDTQMLPTFSFGAPPLEPRTITIPLTGGVQHHLRRHHYIVTAHSIPDIQPRDVPEDPNFVGQDQSRDLRTLAHSTCTPGLTSQERQDEEITEGHRMRMRRSRKKFVVQS